MALLFSIPNLSDDFYRFIWDGKLILNGINPLQFLPSELIADFDAKQFPLAEYLYQGMNSKQTYTCYPPLNQLLFLIGAIFSNQNILGSIVVMKIVILFADIGSYHLIKKLLIQLKMPVNRVFLFWLNPLIILEFSANMHYEGVMIFFFILSVYLLINKRFWISAIAFSLAVSVKLIPLLFLPALFWQLKFKNWIKYCFLVGLLTIILFLPFFNDNNILHFFTSLDLYFQKFEFNASIYYLVRQIGFWIKGYNIIQTAGIVLMCLSFILILLIGFWKSTNEKSKLFLRILFMLSLYYFLSLIIHPWYITTVLLLALFTNFRFPVLWSFIIFLSYYTYSTALYEESMLLVFIEYFLVYFVLLLDLTKNAFYTKLVKRIIP